MATGYLRKIEKINICIKLMKFQLLMKIWDSVYMFSKIIIHFSIKLSSIFNSNFWNKYLKNFGSTYLIFLHLLCHNAIEGNHQYHYSQSYKVVTVKILSFMAGSSLLLQVALPSHCIRMEICPPPLLLPTPAILIFRRQNFIKTILS